MFSKKLKELRKKCKVTQAELGKYLKVSASTIGMYEQGRRKPDSAMLVKICEFFNVTVDYLLKDALIEIENKKMNEKSQLIEIIDDFRNFLLQQKCLMFKGIKLKDSDIEHIVFAIKIGAALVVEKKKNNL